MQNKSLVTLRAIENDGVPDGCNILTGPTHEAYQTNMEALPYNFIMIQHENFKPWSFEQGPVPKNHTLLPGGNFPNYIDVDIILSQNKFGQIQAFKPIADSLNIPVISLEHTWPHPSWTSKRLEALKSMRGDLNVFISEASANAWGWSTEDPSVRVLHHGVNTGKFRPDESVEKDGKVLTVVNDYINRSWAVGYDIYQRVIDGLPANPVGNTPGFSEPLGGENLVKAYQKASVFLNTSTHSPIPMSVLEAMSCGCCVVSTATCAIPEFIEHKVNGFCTNDEEEMKHWLKWSLDNPDEAREMGNKARESAETQFSLKKHLEQWVPIIQEAFGSIHK